VTTLRTAWPARLSLRLPTVVDRRVRAAAWASLVAEILLVATGGAVRLTGSGLGCPTWPRCTAASFVTTPAMGVHGVIEFGNRLLTFVLVLVAVAALLAVVRMRRRRRDLFLLAVAQVASIPAQAVLGGITVWTRLNPWVVGAHFVFSLLLVALMAVFVIRTAAEPGPRELVVPGWFALGSRLAAVLAGVVVLLGILTTGSGPHAGDAHSARNGLDPVVMQTVHSVPAYLLAALTLTLLVAAYRLGRMRRPMTALATVEVVQIVVGVIQARTGLPPVLVDLHLLLAATLVALGVWVGLASRQPVAAAGLHPAAAERLAR
jgi:cytochrome c oxidase assembly protein subunit 15